MFLFLFCFVLFCFVLFFCHFVIWIRVVISDFGLGQFNHNHIERPWWMVSLANNFHKKKSKWTNNSIAINVIESKGYDEMNCTGWISWGLHIFMRYLLIMHRLPYPAFFIINSYRKNITRRKVFLFCFVVFF